MARKRKSQRLKTMYPNCAGIDIGGAEHWVAVNPEQCDDPVRRFGCFTSDLEELADWLASQGVDVVAMESTGVYWIALYEILDARGFEVHLVNSRATRQVSGRKSDVLDCQWIRELMSYGLLQGAFRPPDAVCQLRSLIRQRHCKVTDQSRAIQHMHKALVQMNVQLGQVVSDIAGKTGLAILRAILDGERDPVVLAQLRDGRIKASEATIAKSLQGNWRAEHLFALRQAVTHYDFLREQIMACDTEIEHTLRVLAPTPVDDIPPPAKPLGRDKTRTVAQQENLRQALVAYFGVDLTAIPTIGVETALDLAGEIGTDLSCFPSCGNFASWLALAPPTRISGGKTLPGRSPKVYNRAGQALRRAAVNARRSDSFIGATHRARLARMSCKGQAVKATAHQLARLIYAMLTKGQPYLERGIQAYETERRDRQLKHLRRKAEKLGLRLVEAPAAEAA